MGKTIRMIAIIALIGLVIGIGLKISNLTTDMATDQIDSIRMAERMEKYTIFDGETVCGSDVISAIRSFRLDDISIQVDNGGGDVKNYIYTDTTLKIKSTEKVVVATNKKNIGNGYINPTSKYRSELVYDDSLNGIIVGIRFTIVMVDH